MILTKFVLVHSIIIIFSKGRSRAAWDQKKEFPISQTTVVKGAGNRRGGGGIAVWTLGLSALTLYAFEIFGVRAGLCLTNGGPIFCTFLEPRFQHSFYMKWCTFLNKFIMCRHQSCINRRINFDYVYHVHALSVHYPQHILDCCLNHHRFKINPTFRVSTRSCIHHYYLS